MLDAFLLDVILWGDDILYRLRDKAGWPIQLGRIVKIPFGKEVHWNILCMSEVQ